MALRALTLLAAFAVLPVLAQPAPPGGGAPTPVPVDGGLTLLALAGAGLAARKLRA